MKKKSLIIFGIIALLVLVLGVVAAVVVLNKNNPDNKSNMITITFDTDGGHKIEALKVKKNTKTKLPGAQKDGYTFLAWYLNDKKLESEETFSESVTIKAKYDKIKEDAKTLVITFNSNGGEELKSLTVECEKPLPELPVPKYDGYDFVSWADKYGKVIMKGALISCEYSNTMELVANWDKQVKKFTVTFDSNGGSKVDPVEVECDQKLVMPKSPTRNDYMFMRWEDKNGTPVYDGALLSCEDIKLKAVWEKVKKWKCPSSSYSLVEENGKMMCVTTGTVKSEECASGTRADGNLCVNLTDKADGQHSCPKKAIKTPGGSNETIEGKLLSLKTGETSVSYMCGYHKLDSYPTKESCPTGGGVWTDYGGTDKGCYVEVTSPAVQCPGSYNYYSSADLTSKFSVYMNGGCYKTSNKVKTCHDGYTLIDGKCTMKVEATQE